MEHLNKCVLGAFGFAIPDEKEGFLDLDTVSVSAKSWWDRLPLRVVGPPNGASSWRRLEEPLV
jgi:hypothetical protein